MGIILIKVELKYTNIVKKNNNQDIYIYILWVKIFIKPILIRWLVVHISLLFQMIMSGIQLRISESFFGCYKLIKFGRGWSNSIWLRPNVFDHSIIFINFFSSKNHRVITFFTYINLISIKNRDIKIVILNHIDYSIKTKISSFLLTHGNAVYKKIYILFDCTAQISSTREIEQLWIPINNIIWTEPSSLRGLPQLWPIKNRDLERVNSLTHKDSITDMYTFTNYTSLLQIEDPLRLKYPINK